MPGFVESLREQLPGLELLTEPADTDAYRYDET